MDNWVIIIILAFILYVLIYICHRCHKKQSEDSSFNLSSPPLYGNSSAYNPHLSSQHDANPSAPPLESTDHSAYNPHPISQQDANPSAPPLESTDHGAYNLHPSSQQDANPSAPPLGSTDWSAYNPCSSHLVVNLPNETEMADMNESVIPGTSLYEGATMPSSLLECGVCLESLAPPVHIWQCQSGHPLCEDCKINGAISLCPVCRKDIIGRNHVFENIAKELFVNVDQEGSKVKSVADLERRQLKESFVCPICDRRFSSIEQLTSHFEEHHIRAIEMI